MITAMLGLPAMAQALPTCASVLEQQSYEDQLGPVDYEATRADCTINWVQNGRMLSLDWTAAPDFDVVELQDRPDGSQVLATTRQPHLIDIDQDGWLDVAVFTLLGMVNGDYDVFRYDPDSYRFAYFGTMNGSQFTRHADDYVVAVGRSSAAASGVDVFKVSPNGIIPEASLYVDAGLETGLDGAPECRVTVDGETYTNPTHARIGEIYPDAPGLIANFCGLYGGIKIPGTRLMDVPVDPVIVPDGTVFYCQLQGTTKAVTVTFDGAGYRYAFGPQDGPPELILDRPIGQVRVLPDNGAGPSRFGEISFQNGAYEYIVSYGYEVGNFTDSGFESLREETFQRGLIVIQDEDYANPVFDRSCDPDLSYDSIEFLRRS